MGILCKDLKYLNHITYTKSEQRNYALRTDILAFVSNPYKYLVFLCSYKSFRSFQWCRIIENSSILKKVSGVQTQVKTRNAKCFVHAVLVRRIVILISAEIQKLENFFKLFVIKIHKTSTNTQNRISPLQNLETRKILKSVT